jgi:hypothetical protein
MRPTQEDFMTLNLSRRTFLRASTASAGAVALGPLLAGCETTAAPAPSTGFPLIVDTATRLDAAKAAGLRAAGVKTVFRYYCHLPPSLPEKDLTPAEARLILEHGLSLAVVFQHYNNCFRTFENRWGREDAEQALRQAEAVGQPAGSAVYFGVDGDWPYVSMIDPVTAYFDDVARAFEGSGLSVGVYSNGCLANAVMERGFASYAWLSGSTAHTGTQAFYNTGRWSLFQNALDIRVGEGAAGIAIDTNLAGPGAGGYFGQFDARGARTAAHPDAEASALRGARRFVRANADVKATADSASATLASVRKDQNVRTLESGAGWTRVLTQEGGARSGAAGASVEGWLPTASLASLDSFPDGTTAYGICGSGGSLPDAQKYQSCAPATSRLR